MEKKPERFVAKSVRVFLPFFRTRPPRSSTRIKQTVVTNLRLSGLEALSPTELESSLIDESLKYWGIKPWDSRLNGYIE